MVDLRGFNGIRFNAEKTGTLDHVLTPPYDVIDEDARAQYAKSNPFNMTHLMLPVAEASEDKYHRAARLFQEWRKQSVLLADEKPYLYLLRQRFSDPEGGLLERKAFFSILRLPKGGERQILGHERTFEKPVEDRLALLRAVKANLEPVFLLYADPDRRISGQLFKCMEETTPVLQADTADGVRQEMWRTGCPEYLTHHLREQTLYIADGHHRFKTACTYRDECGFSEKAKQAPYPQEYMMAGFVALEDPGLKIYPAHRIVSCEYSFNFEDFRKKLFAYFTCIPLKEGLPAPQSLLDAEARCAIVMVTQEQGRWLLQLREEKRTELVGDDRSPAWQDLDVAVLHRGILDHLLGIPDSVNLVYEKDAQTAESLVNNGEGALAFLLRPTRAEQVRACAEAFEPMPQKSTYFFPKLPSGAVMYSFEC